MKTKIFFLFLLCVFSAQAKNNYRLLYSPCDKYTISVRELGQPFEFYDGTIAQEVIATYTSVTYEWLSKYIAQQAEKDNIKIFYDVSSQQPGETNGAYLVFLCDDLVVALFNYGNKSYITGKHQLVSRQKYFNIFYGIHNGRKLSLEEMEKSLDVEIFSLNQEYLKSLIE
jgi:hypothetical protein